ncbi:MAG: metallophosphoesterase [Deltaproteobacteria bacterium]|nr:metallophosphoesterase [Deltaproteobacteria bacterium]
MVMGLWSLGMVAGLPAWAEPPWPPPSCGRETLPLTSGKPLRFAALGDQGSGDADQWAVANSLKAWCEKKGCDMVLLLGDNFYPGGVVSQQDPKWVEMFSGPYGKIPAPFYALLGNHDYKSDDPRRGAVQLERHAQDPHWNMPGNAYALAAGPALFLAMDTVRLERLGEAEAQAQGRCLAQARKESRAPWTIALGHYPVMNNGRHLVSQTLKDFYQKNLCGPLDLALAGHDHNLQVLDGPPECPGLFVVSGGGGKAIYPLNGSAPHVFQRESYGFVYGVVTPTTLTLTLVNRNGRVLFEKTVQKK